MPNKHNDARRHHIPKMTFKVTNWSAYEAGLRRRGSLREHQKPWGQLRLRHRVMWVGHRWRAWPDTKW
jgi:hypothetical protein